MLDNTFHPPNAEPNHTQIIASPLSVNVIVVPLLKVDGVGETKLKKYGKAFLEAINKHV